MKPFKSPRQMGAVLLILTLTALFFQNCGSPEGLSVDTSAEARRLSSLVSDAATSSFYTSPTRGGGGTMIPTPECPDRTVNERFNAVYHLQGVNPDPTWKDWGYYSTLYKGYRIWVGCHGDRNHDPSAYASACEAECTWKITYDCYGKIRHAQQNNGQVACHSASLRNFVNGSWAAQVKCQNPSLQDFEGLTCQN